MQTMNMAVERFANRITLAMRAGLASLAVVALVSCRSSPPACAYRDFVALPAEHIVDTIDAPYSIGSFTGKLTIEDSDRWPEQLPISFEVHGASGRVLFVKIRPDGSFGENLPPGEYYFKIASPLTRIYFGRFIVDPAAAPDSTILLRMRWGT